MFDPVEPVTTLRFGAGVCARLARAVLEAYPEEGCGLLLGRCEGRGAILTRAEPSRNASATPRTAFEVDPALRLRLERTARGTGERVLGLFHSHPDGPAAPSRADLAAAIEPGLLWVIAGVAGGRLSQLAAFQNRGTPEAARFIELEILPLGEPGAPA